MDGFEIRKVRSGDAAAVSRISSEDLGYPCDAALVEKRIANLDGRREAVFVAVADGAVIGYIHVERYELLYYESMANILGIAVRQEFRRRGAGKALLCAAEGWAKENAISVMRLNSGSSRTDAHAFYRHLGYDAEKEQKRFLKHI